jgi:hypothetical protein
VGSGWQFTPGKRPGSENLDCSGNCSRSKTLNGLTKNLGIGGKPVLHCKSSRFPWFKDELMLWLAGKSPIYLTPPPKSGSQVFKESCAMSDKLLVNLWGASISADGVWAIGAAVVIVLVIALARRTRT